MYIGTVMAKIRTEFNVPDSAQCRLWQRFMTNTYELMTKANKTLSEAGLYSGQVSETKVVNFLLLVSPITQLLMLEVKGDDDKWPRDKVNRDDSMVPKAVSSRKMKKNTNCS